jgi:MOSC domain-containing protein YiiM
LTVERIYTRKRPGGPQTSHEQVQIVAGAGIEGDRYFDHHDEPGQNVTFVEAEAIETFLAEYDAPRDLSITGRNVVTRGIRLNELVGREFFVGSVRFRGVELCEPCMLLGKALALPALPATAVVKRLAHRAGLRADALSSGELAVGAKFETAA